MCCQAIWTGSVSGNLDEEPFFVEIARTGQGVFGRMSLVWNEARGQSVKEVVRKVVQGAEPFFARQRSIGQCVGLGERYAGLFSDLKPIDYLKLLYCIDRDIAHDAQVQIETHASSGDYSEALILILRDQSHPNRRSAQWCVLDMFEDLPSFCPEHEAQKCAVMAIRDLIAGAEDDYARTIYKAGVVLGGHICTSDAAEALFDCARSATKYGRRSAIHSLFHLAEWMPEVRERILTTLLDRSQNDPEVSLREFAASMASDIKRGSFDHMTEPVFSEEA